MTTLILTMGLTIDSVGMPLLKATKNFPQVKTPLQVLMM